MNNIVSTTLHPPKDLSKEIPNDDLSKPKIPDFNKLEDLIHDLPNPDKRAIQSFLNRRAANNIPAYLQKVWESNHMGYSFPNMGTTFHNLTQYESVYERLQAGANLWGRARVQNTRQPETHWLKQILGEKLISYPDPDLPFDYSESVWLVHSMNAGNQDILPYLVDIFEDPEDSEGILKPVEGTRLALHTPVGIMTITLRSVCLQLKEWAFDQLAPILQIHNLMHPAEIIR